jgi:hypothetical protein
VVLRAIPIPPALHELEIWEHKSQIPCQLYSRLESTNLESRFQRLKEIKGHDYFSNNSRQVCDFQQTLGFSNSAVYEAAILVLQATVSISNGF